MDIRDRWMTPPDPAPADLEIRAICGTQAVLVRAAILGALGPEHADALVETLSPSAAELLRGPPAADAWIPAGDVLEILFESENLKPLMRSSVLPRLTAERDAGRLPPFDPPAYAKLLPGCSPRDALMAVDAIFKARYAGGSARLDALEAQEAWASIWAHPLWPGWASHGIPEWFKRVLEAHYKIQCAVTYVAAPEDRPWWHRYHFRWF